MATSRIDRIAGKISCVIGDPDIDTMAVRDTINGISEVTSGQEADVLHGPWQVIMVDHHGVICGPLDLDEHQLNRVTITITRAYPLGLWDAPNHEVAYHKTGFTSLDEARAAYLRAQAMCAGLNLTSLLNGIHPAGK